MNYSPLRYPGGKSKIAPLVRLVIEKTGYNEPIYIEPFAGGAGVAMNLLVNDSVDAVVINDYDKAVYSFWRAVKDNTNELIRLINTVPLSIEEWRRQKDIYANQREKFSLELGFSAFYLNRTNRSGILSAGPIGGQRQDGNYCIDVRFNRANLVHRIQEISRRKSRLMVYNKEIRSFIQNILPRYGGNSLVYFDPPYFNKGQHLYKNYLTETDHADIANCIINNVNSQWIITYDNVPQLNNLYSAYVKRKYSLNYSAAVKGKGSEIIIFKSPELLPSDDELHQRMPKFLLAEI